MSTLYLEWRDRQRIKHFLACLTRRRFADDPRALEGGFARLARLWLGVQ